MFLDPLYFLRLGYIVVWWVVGCGGLFCVCRVANGSVGLGDLVVDTAPCSFDLSCFRDFYLMVLLFGPVFFSCLH